MFKGSALPVSQPVDSSHDCGLQRDRDFSQAMGPLVIEGRGEGDDRG